MVKSIYYEIKFKKNYLNLKYLPDDTSWVDSARKLSKLANICIFLFNKCKLIN